MATTRVRAKQILQAPLPPLNVGTSKTTSSALHGLEYVGTLSPWPNFKSQVEAFYNTQAFARSAKAAVSPGLHNVDPEIVCVGDEHGLQGRFQQAIGQVLGAALEAQGVNLHFADFKCSGLQYQNVPDVVGLSTIVQGTAVQGTTVQSRKVLRLVGELKVPWVPQHSLRDAYDKPQRLRHILGQPLLHMGELGSAFGFMSTYNQTIFLRQIQLPSGNWHVEYSPINGVNAAEDPSLSTRVLRDEWGSDAVTVVTGMDPR
ncbi:hypothetical protein PENPOL_c002G10652 [Penicillium polonicum]|uniref:Uncharacterized protein n=1 Tax=Penicillium polonicum TaxID=60169 RepID=A0A1V6NXJ0_PENPO|nr:hypothetical protein PENPOL_c002G10652 [Penicillium polonicum]